MGLAALLGVARADAQQLSTGALIEQGIALRRAGRDDAAWAAFDAAYARCHCTEALADRGLAAAALSRWVDAERDLVEALGDTQDPFVQRFGTQLQRELLRVRTHVAAVTVLVDVPAARAMFDEEGAQAVPSEGLVLRVAEGAHRLVVEAPGRETTTRTITVVGGADVRMELALRPVEVVALVTPVAPVVQEAAPALSPVSLPEVQPAAGVMPRRPLSWPWFATAGSALALGVAANVAQQVLVARWNDDACLANGLTRRENCAAEGDTADAMWGLTIGGYLAAGVLLTVGVIRRVRGASRESARALACAPSLRGASCVWRF